MNTSPITLEMGIDWINIFGIQEKPSKVNG
jgi:hypothetical protein